MMGDSRNDIFQGFADATLYILTYKTADHCVLRHTADFPNFTNIIPDTKVHCEMLVILGVIVLDDKSLIILDNRVHYNKTLMISDIRVCYNKILLILDIRIYYNKTLVIPNSSVHYNKTLF